MNVLLRLAESIYQTINGVRRQLYRAGVLRARRLPAPVISIGNIVAGGAGKTPAVIAVARHLVASGLHVAVLTRGYGRSGAGGKVTSLDAEKFGDEPVLIKRHVSQADVLVGKNRFDNGLRNSASVYVLDDGFQHLQLHRDLDVVIDVPHSRFSRERRSALRHADIVLERRFRIRDAEKIRGREWFAFAGLADNEQFFATLRQAGATLAGTRSFADHHAYTDADIAELRRQAAGTPLITTEKDGVKIQATDIETVAIDFEIAPDILARIEEVARRAR